MNGYLLITYEHPPDCVRQPADLSALNIETENLF